jgi:hypothetical protein
LFFVIFVSKIKIFGLSLSLLLSHKRAKKTNF